MNLLTRLFPKAATLIDLQKKIGELKSECEATKRANSEFASANTELKIAKSEIETECVKLRAKLRAQNEADLLLVSTQIVRRITNGEQLTENDEAVLRQRALLRAQSQFAAQMQQAQRSSSWMQGLQNAVPRSWMI